MKCLRSEYLLFSRTTYDQLNTRKIHICKGYIVIFTCFIVLNLFLQHCTGYLLP